jgi:hypothetical protein
MTVNAEMIVYFPDLNMKDVFYEYTPAIFKKQRFNRNNLKLMKPRLL